MNRPLTVILSAGILLAAVPGCRTGRTEADAAAKGDTLDPSLLRAEALYREGRYNQAMLECIDAGRQNPDAEGLTDLQRRISIALAEQRQARVMALSQAGMDNMNADADERKIVPGTYGLTSTVKGDSTPLRSVPSSMENVLKQKVTVHLDDVTLDDFILAMGAAENVNIIADNAIDDTATMTIHAENIPMREILNYVSRNMGVTFSIGDNIIWATPGSPTDERIPLETRMYRLRKGLSGEEIAGGEDGISIVTAIRRFVPETPGSELMFDKRAHVLIVRNTRESLAKVEDIIEALDVAPPQVMIEARFISTSVSDLRELGIDWVLNSPLGVRKKYVLENGQMVERNATQIQEGAAVAFTPFANELQGLNLTYQGLLTDPMFEAVLHALETSGKSRTLSVPKVTTVNNRLATIRIGEDFRYFEEYDVISTPVSDASDRTTYANVIVPVGTPTLEELGIQLDVTPSVGADKRSIMLHLMPEISEFVRYESYEVSDQASANNSTLNNQTTNATSLIRLPIFRRSKIETEVVVQSGETVVMGGLILSQESKTEERVPILSSIPILGRLFRNEGVEEQKRNLLIFVTASLLSERGVGLVPLIEQEPSAAAQPPAAEEPGIATPPAQTRETPTPAVENAPPGT